MGDPLMVVRNTGKVGRVFGKIYAHEIILRLRFNDGYEANFRLTDLQAASAEQIQQFEREELKTGDTSQFSSSKSSSHGRC